MKYSSKNRTAAMCKPCCPCVHTAPAKVNVANTYAKVKIANPTVVWDYKESIYSDKAENNSENKPDNPVNPNPANITHHAGGDSSRANRGRLNEMVLG